MERFSVLIVDDDPIVRQIVKEVFSNFFNCSIEEAGDGSEALDILKKEKFNLLFTDYEMPILKGGELIRQAKEMHPDIKSILMSGGNPVEVTAVAVSAGANEVLSKPLYPFLLRGIVERLLS